MKQSSDLENPITNLLQSFGSLLCCPDTQQSLHCKNSFFLNDTGIKYPIIESIPWLVPQPQMALQHWLDKKNELNLYFNQRLQSVQSSQQNLGLSALTAERLQKIEKALKHNQKTLMQILAPLDTPETNSASRLLTQIPSHQSLTLYFKNIFRDWLWSTEENEAAVNFLKKILPPTWNPEKFLILGSGASRLALDLHHHYHLKNTLATDFNPLLFLFAQQALTQKPLSLYDLPTAPLNFAESVHEYFLHNPYPFDTHFHLLFADIHKLPFKEKSFNAVLTPWVIDILPIKVPVLAQKINSLLPLGGEWLNFGPLGFMFSDEADRLTFEELNEVLGQNGFKIEKHQSEFLPYLHSPGSGQKRFENTFAFRATKIKDHTVQESSALPLWLLDHSQPIPYSSAIKYLQSQAKVNADILFSIDGRRSINELTALMGIEYKIPADQAQHLIVSFLKRLAESQMRSDY